MSWKVTFNKSQWVKNSSWQNINPATEEKQDDIIEPSEAKSMYVPITDQELLKDFDEWGEKRQIKDLNYGRDKLTKS